MSTATGIEIATGTLAQSLGSARSLAKTQSTGLATTDASSPAAATSFRSSWQALLAALGSCLEGASGDESGTGAALGSAGAAWVKTAGTEAAASTSQTAVAALTVSAGKTQEAKTAADVAAISEAGSQAGGSAWTAASAIKRQTTVVQSEKSTTKDHAAGAASETHSAKSAKSETTSTGTAEQVSAVPESAQQILSASVQQGTVVTPIDAAVMPISEAAPAMTIGLGGAAKGTASLSVGEIGTAGSQATNQVGESALSGKASSASATEVESEEPQVGAVAQKGSVTEGALSRSTLRDSAPVSGTASSLATSSSQRPASLGVHGGTSDPFPASLEATLSSGNEPAAIGKGEATAAQIPIRAASENQLQSLPSGNNQAQSAGTETLAATAGGDGLQASAVVADTAKSQSSQSLATSSMGKKAGAVPAGRAAEQAASRSTQQGRTADPMQSSGLSTAGQSGLAVQDGAGLVRDSSGEHGATGTTGNTAGESAAAAVSREGSASSETFSALDAGSPTTPTWIHAGAHRAEAGFQDPSLGWVGVRADSSGGSVHASLVAGSADAAQTLSGHLAGLNAYLADQHAAVGAVTMATSEDRSAAYSMDQTMNQNMNQGTGQDGGGGQHPVPAVSVTTFPSTGSAGSAARTEVSAPEGSLGGTHISLIA